MIVDLILKPFEKRIYLQPSRVNKDLPKYLEKISKVFDLDSIINEEQTTEKINTYYEKSALGYRLFNTDDRFIHFALSDQPILKKDDYLGLTRIVENSIREHNAEKILELAPGKGANLLYLSGNFPKAHFQGIELSQKPIKDIDSSKNVEWSYGDYHDLSSLPDNYFDLVYIIEALCYSQKKKEVIKQVYKKLREGGIFIISDGYRLDVGFSKEEEIARKLIERGMALNEVETKETIKQGASEVGFQVVEEIDLTLKIIPTARKFEFLARGLFKFRFLAKLIVSVFSVDFAKNALSGLLLNTLLERGLAGYYVHVLQKSEAKN